MIIARVGRFIFNGDLNTCPYNQAIKAQEFIKTFKPQHEKACVADNKQGAAVLLAKYMAPVVAARGLNPADFTFTIDIKDVCPLGMFWDESYQPMQTTAYPLVVPE